MPRSRANEKKAQFIFGQVFGELSLQWTGPEFDSDRQSYKAVITHGDLKRKLLYISVESLEDTDVSAEHIKQKLLAQLKQELVCAQQKKV
jgi:hypothetical protein